MPLEEVQVAVIIAFYVGVLFGAGGIILWALWQTGRDDD